MMAYAGPPHDGTPPAVSSPPGQLRRAGMPHRKGKGTSQNISYPMPRPFRRQGQKTKPANRRRARGQIGYKPAPVFSPPKEPVSERPPPVFSPPKEPIPEDWGKP